MSGGEYVWLVLPLSVPATHLCNHDARVVCRDGALDVDDSLRGPSAGVIDAERGTECVLDEGQVCARADGDGVCNRVAAAHVDIDAVSRPDDDGGHLNVPVDKGR